MDAGLLQEVKDRWKRGIEDQMELPVCMLREAELHVGVHADF